MRQSVTIRWTTGPYKPPKTNAWFFLAMYRLTDRAMHLLFSHIIKVVIFELVSDYNKFGLH